MAARKKRHSRNKGLAVIALTKLAHAGVMLAATIAAVRLMHKNVPQHVASWIDNVPLLDPDNRYIAALLQKLRVVHTKELKELSALGFLYVGLFSVEGVGLWLEQRWAEWLTLVTTGLLIPIELVELWREFGAGKLILLLINIAIVAFLAFLVRRKKRRD